MAVTTTPRAIINSAYGKSLKNKPGTIATESTELLQVVIRALRTLYALAARVNPTYFATQTDVAFAGSGWERPETAESIFRIERVAGTTGGTGSAGDLVVLVPYDDREAESGIGSVYRLGRTFFPAGNTPDPTGGDLRFWYASRPATPADLDSTLDASWAEQFNELLILEVARYLALKDDRGGELTALTEERNREVALFTAFLEHTESNERRRSGHVRRFNTNTLVPLFGGGAS